MIACCLAHGLVERPVEPASQAEFERAASGVRHSGFRLHGPASHAQQVRLVHVGPDADGLGPAPRRGRG